MKMRWIVLAVVSLVLTGAGFLLSRHHEAPLLPPVYGPNASLGGGYYLVREANAQVSLCRWIERPEGDCTDILPGDIFAVGYDSRYIVIRQHPDGNTAMTNNYYLPLAGSASHEAGAAFKVPNAYSDLAFPRRQFDLTLPHFRKSLPKLVQGKDRRLSEV